VCLVLVAALFAVAPGCSDDPAVPPRDAGAVADAAALVDGGFIGDASGFDAGHVTARDDAGAAMDAAMDAGPPPDAGRIPTFAECSPWTDLRDPGMGFDCGGIRPSDRGPFDGRVALTFDDGPSPTTTPMIVDILRRESVPATFFMLGQRLATDTGRAIAADIHADPLFRISNHSHSHPSLPDLSAAATAMQIDQTDDLLRRAAGDPCYFPRYFRFPYGDASCDTVAAVRERGLSVVGWHIDSSDWCFAAHGGTCPASEASWIPEAVRSDMVAHVEWQLERFDGGILLLHDIHRFTVDQLPALIARVRELGYRFVPLDDADAFPLVVGNAMPTEPPMCCHGVVR
jgi:peptidoglycan/xylan/chitin deacetylase (PgdA/CDA1 family)